MFKQKTILITGGTGSFGSSFVEHLLRDEEIGEARVFSRDEKKQEDLRFKLKNPSLSFVVGDIRDRDRLTQALRGVDYVFHAAALKQVPSCEDHPSEAIKTNVLGTENLIFAAEKNQTKKVVLLSTDKAVEPVNVMGMTKALMEKIALSHSKNYAKKGGPIFCCTRYGNVICSRGSVIPIFLDQIQSGKSLTMTTPFMTRFMMSLEDSVHLALKAFEKGLPGDIFVQKSPAVKVETLCQALIKMTQKTVALETMGSRPGEKYHETLISEREMERALDCGTYYRIPMHTDDSSKRTSPGAYTSLTTTQLDVEETEKLLLSIPAVQKRLYA